MLVVLIIYVSAAHKIYAYGSSDIPIPSTQAGQNTQESYLAWKNFSPITLSNTVATQFPDCACGHVKVFNPHGNDLVAVGGSGASDLPYFYPNNPGLARGTVIHPGTGYVFKVTNMNLLAAIALRNGDIIDPQAALSQTDFTTPTNDPAPNAATLPPLSISSTTPANSATNVPTNQTISIVFNRQLDPTTVNTTNISISPTVSFSTTAVDSTNNFQVDINPNGTNLVSGTVYTVTVNTSVKDTFGLTLLSPFTFTFTVGVVPTVLSVIPGNNATGIGANTNVKVAMSQSMDGTTVTTSNVKLINTSNSSTVTSTVSLGSDMQTITITPSSNLAFSTKYKVTLNNVKAASGIGGAFIAPNPYDGVTQGPNQGAFTTSASLTVTSVTPGNNAVNVAVNTHVTILMSAQVKSAGVTTANVKLINVGTSATVTSTVSLGTDNETITLTPSSNLAVGTQYKVTVQNLQDLNGVTMSPSPWDGVTQGPNAGVFTTVPPTLNVVSVTPGSNATNVALNTTVVVVMNTAILPADMTSSNFQLLDTGNSNAQITCTYALSAGNTTITMTPSSSLSNSDTYKVVVQNVHNTASVVESPNPWDGASQGPNSGVFTTIPPVPVVQSVTPGNNATNQPVTGNIAVVFNTPIANADINTTNIQLINTETSAAFTTTVSQTGDTITINPSGNLATNTTYKTTLNNLHNTNSVLQSPNPYDPSTPGSLTSVYNVAQNLSYAHNPACSPNVNGYACLVNTSGFFGEGEFATVANGIVGGIVTKVTIGQVRTQIASGGHVGIAIVQANGNTIYTFTSTFTIGSGGSAGTGPFTLIDNANTYVMQAGDAVVVTWDQGSSNGLWISEGTAGGFGSACKYNGSSLIADPDTTVDLAAQIFAVGATTGANCFTTGTQTFTQRYSVSQNASPCNSGANGYGPNSVDDFECQNLGKTGLLGTFANGQNTCTGVAFGEVASAGNGLTAAPIVKVVITQITGDDINSSTGYGAHSAPTGTIGVKIVSSSGSTHYTFASTFTASSTGWSSLCNYSPSCGGGSSNINGWSNVTLIDTGNTYQMVAGDAIMITWSGTGNNLVGISQNSSGPYGKAVYQHTSGSTPTTISGMDVAMICYSTP